jgi:hypothetical protein
MSAESVGLDVLYFIAFGLFAISSYRKSMGQRVTVDLDLNQGSRGAVLTHLTKLRWRAA